MNTAFTTRCHDNFAPEGTTMESAPSIRLKPKWLRNGRRIEHPIAFLIRVGATGNGWQAVLNNRTTGSEIQTRTPAPIWHFRNNLVQVLSCQNIRSSISKWPNMFYNLTPLLQTKCNDHICFVVCIRSCLGTTMKPREEI